MTEAQGGYIDFDVAIGARSDDGYPLELLNSPFGNVHTVMTLPFDDAALAGELVEIRQIVNTPGYALGRAQLERAGRARDFGVALFTALLGSGLSQAYGASRSIAEANGQLLRIKLRIRAPELASLPWELLYDPVVDAHVLLKNEVSLVRLPESAGPVRQLTVDGPVRILGVVVDLPSAPSVGAREEREHVDAALSNLRAQGTVDIEWLDNPSWRDLLTAMDRGPWHVVHFIGHAFFDEASGDGYVVVASEEDDGGQPVPYELSAADLASAVADTGDVRLAVINACDSSTGRPADGSGGTAHRLVEAGLSAAIGMQNVIHDDAAVEFSRQLYEHLARMRPLDSAVAAARKAIDLAVPQTLQWAIPSLHSRAPNGDVFKRPLSSDPAVRVPELLDDGVARFHEGNLGRAIEVFDQALILEPDRADLVVWRALADATSGYDEADDTDVLERTLPALDVLLAARPSDVQLVGLRGMGLAVVGRFAEAITDLDKSVSAQPDLAGTRLARARCHLAAGTPRRAIADLDVAVRLVAHSAEPLVLRALAYGEVDDHRQAIADLTDALTIQPTGPFRRARSAHYAALDEYGMAASDLDFELERSESAGLYEQRGRLRYRRAYYGAAARDYGPAVEDFTAALELDPDNVDLFAARGRAHYEHSTANDDAGSARESAEDYRRATELRPEDGWLHYRLGRALDLSRNGSAARSAYRAAAKLGVREARDALPFWRRWGL